MRKLLLAVPVVALLSGCVSPDSPTPNVNVGSIQAAFQTACGLAIQANNLAPIIGMFTGLNVAQYTAIAAQLCGSFQPTNSVARNGKRVYVANIRGHRISAVKVR